MYINKKILSSFAVLGLLFLLAADYASFQKPSLEKNDRIVFMGDSITAAGVRPDGYVTLTSRAINEAYPNMGIAVIGMGIPGYKVPDCQNHLLHEVLNKKPSIVVIFIGINDVWQWRKGNGTKKNAFATGLHDLIARINAAGARAILCTPTVIGEKRDRTNRFDNMLDAYSEISRTVAKKTGCQLIDLRKQFIAYLTENNPHNLPKGILTIDGVHLNKKGNFLLSDIMLRTLHVPVAK